MYRIQMHSLWRGAALLSLCNDGLCVQQHFRLPRHCLATYNTPASFAASHHLPRGLHVQEALIVLETRSHHQLALAFLHCATVLMFAGPVILTAEPGALQFWKETLTVTVKAEA